jgi:hypothetical protein
MQERVRPVNCIQGLLTGQATAAFDPACKDCRTRLHALTTRDGRPLPSQVKLAGFGAG